jgi:hypothetical protein
VTRRDADTGLDFETLRLGIERCDPDVVLGFYAEDAVLSIVNAVTPKAPPFELRGRAEIAKHLRAVYGQEATHRVEEMRNAREGVVTFVESCRYRDGGRVVVRTTLDVRDGKVARQTDLVAEGTRADREGVIGFSQPERKTRGRAPEGGASRPDRLSASEAQPIRRLSDDVQPI